MQHASLFIFLGLHFTELQVYILGQKSFPMPPKKFNKGCCCNIIKCTIYTWIIGECCGVDKLIIIWFLKILRNIFPSILHKPMLSTWFCPKSHLIGCLHMKLWHTTGPTFTNSDQLEPWIKNQVTKALLPTVLPLSYNILWPLEGPNPPIWHQILHTSAGASLRTGKWSSVNP